MKHFDETRNQCFGNTPKVREKYAHFKNWNYHMFKPINNKIKDDNILEIHTQLSAHITLKF